MSASFNPGARFRRMNHFSGYTQFLVTSFFLPDPDLRLAIPSDLGRSPPSGRHFSQVKPAITADRSLSSLPSRRVIPLSSSEVRDRNLVTVS
jgi:hypothetical protein